MQNNDTRNTTQISVPKKNIITKRGQRELNRKANATSLEKFIKSSKEYEDFIEKIIQVEYIEAISNFDDFMESINIKLNEDINTKDLILDQYNQLEKYKKEHLDFINNNEEKIKVCSDKLTEISSDLEEINKISVKNKKLLDDLITSLNDSNGDINDFIDEYKELNETIKKRFATKYSELKNYIKDALIKFYSKQFNSLFSNRKTKINSNYESITNETPDTKKVEILISIKGTIDDLNNIYLGTVEGIKNNIKINESNKNLKTYQTTISSKINELNSELNKKIDNIKTATYDDIDKIKKDVSSLIEQIKKLITEYSTKHNYSNANANIALEKLNKLALLNNFSTKNLNEAVEPIINQLSNILERVERNKLNKGESNTGNKIVTIMNQEENILENNNVFIILNRNSYEEIKNNKLLTFYIKNDVGEPIKYSAEIDINRKIEEQGENIKIPIKELSTVLPNGKSILSIPIKNFLKNKETSIVNKNGLSKIGKIEINNNEKKPQESFVSKNQNKTVNVQTNSKKIKINKEAYEKILRELYTYKFKLNHSNQKFEDIGMKLLQKYANNNSKNNQDKEITIETERATFIINPEIFYRFYSKFDTNVNGYQDMDIISSKQKNGNLTNSNIIRQELIISISLNDKKIYDSILKPYNKVYYKKDGTLIPGKIVGLTTSNLGNPEKEKKKYNFKSNNEKTEEKFINRELLQKKWE